MLPVSYLLSQFSLSLFSLNRWRCCLFTHRLAVANLVAHGVRHLGLQNLVMMDGGGVNLDLDVTAVDDVLLGPGGWLSGHGLERDKHLCDPLLLLLGLLLHLLLLGLLLPRLLLHLGLHLTPEVVDHLLLVLLVHVEERGGRVVPGPDKTTRIRIAKVNLISGIPRNEKDIYISS